jgi:hypothetical protein
MDGAKAAETADNALFEVGDVVIVNSKHRAVVRYIGAPRGGSVVTSAPRFPAPHRFRENAIRFTIRLRHPSSLASHLLPAGPTAFAEGVWYGLELDREIGASHGAQRCSGESLAARDPCLVSAMVFAWGECWDVKL